MVSGVLTDPSTEQILLYCTQYSVEAGLKVIAKISDSNARMSNRLSASLADLTSMSSAGNYPEILNLASAISDLRVAVTVLSPIACANEAAAILFERSADCASSARRLKGSLSDVRSTGERASLDRFIESLSNVDKCVRLSLSVVRGRLLVGTMHIVNMWAISDRLSAALENASNVPPEDVIRDSMQTLVTVCEASRAGMLAGAKGQVSQWSDVLGAQKRVLAEAMYCERCGRPFLGETELSKQDREQALDAMFLAAFRLRSTTQAFLGQHVAPEEALSSPQAIRYIGQLVESSVARLKFRRVVALTLALALAVNNALKRVQDETVQRNLFRASLEASNASFALLFIYDQLDGSYATKDSAPEWQRLGPERQVERLQGGLWDTSALIDTASALVAICKHHEKVLDGDVATLSVNLREELDARKK